MESNILNSQVVPEGWQARLDLRLAARAGGHTVLEHVTHHGPLRVQRPFFPEGPGVCHLYLLHPPGGIVGGDHLEIDAQVGAHAHAVLTTPAATKFYRCPEAPSAQKVQLTVASGAVLEWLPQENILYDGAHSLLSTRVDVAPDAHFCGWEITCLGRPASGEGYTHGALTTRFEVWSDNQPLLWERGGVEGSSPVLTAPWGYGGRSLSALLVATDASASLVERIRTTVSPHEPDALFGVTQVDGVLICRYLGHQALAARATFAQAWSVWRTQVLARAACMPRIWRT